MSSTGYAKGRATRARILTAATGRFARVGFRGTSIRDIASAGGVSHHVVLYHFATKAELLEAVLDQRYRGELTATAPATDTRAVFGAILSGVAERSRDLQAVELHATISAEAMAPDHPAHTYFVRRYAILHRETTAAFRAAERAGSLRPGIDPAAAARSLVAVLDGLQVQWLIDPSTDMVEVAHAHLQTILTTPLPLPRR